MSTSSRSTSPGGQESIVLKVDLSDLAPEDRKKAHLLASDGHFTDDEFAELLRLKRGMAPEQEQYTSVEVYKPPRKLTNIQKMQLQFVAILFAALVITALLAHFLGA